MPRAIAIRHVAFEDLGSFAPVLEARGWDVEYVDAPTSQALQDDPALLVVLGGPISVNDGEIFSFLEWERTLLAQRIARDLPTIGICLGAQLMAAALNAKVSAMPQKEIGFSSVTLTQTALEGPLSPFANNDLAVLHWHGEECALPTGAKLLASTPLCNTQAFSYGEHCLALQFHVEAEVSTLERWYVGHTAELSAAGIQVPELRAQAARFGVKLRDAAQVFLDRWLDERKLQARTR
jgi:GMP synthase (glutamine-hydrolysing)